jgi:serine/threonine-protein kinase
VAGTTLRELNEAHAGRRRRWLRDARPELPSSFVRAVDAAIAVLPEHRPDSAGAMEALLERAAGRSGSDTPRSMRRTEREKPAGPSIAVLPFADLSPDRSLAYFCEGIAEEILEALRAVPGVRVVGRSSAFRFTSSVDDPRQIGEALNVGSVLEGSVRTSGNRLRVVARLIDTLDGAHLWSERFDRQLDDVFAVQDEIAQASARALGARLGEAAPGRGLAPGAPATHNLDAYTLYLKGRFCWNQRTELALKRSLTYFEEAVEKDASYASAHAGLADAYATLGLYGVLAPDDAMPKARAAARRAIDLAGSLSAPHATLACVTAIYDWNWGVAEAGYRRAITLNAGDPDAHHWYAINHLVPLQRFDEAAEALRLAREADPLSTPIRVSGGIFSYFAHRFDEAERQLHESLDLDAGSSTARLFLGLSLVERGRPDEALRQLGVAQEVSPRPEITAAVGYACAKAGDVSGARRALDELRRLDAERYVSPSLIAQVHAGLGENQAALDWLERARTCRATDLAWLAVRPVFDPLRQEPAVAKIIAALGL